MIYMAVGKTKKIYAGNSGNYCNSCFADLRFLVGVAEDQK